MNGQDELDEDLDRDGEGNLLSVGVEVAAISVNIGNRAKDAVCSVRGRIDSFVQYLP